MPETLKININPLLEILRSDMSMYNELFQRVNSLRWKSHYGKPLVIAELLSITETLGMKDIEIPKDEFGFAKIKGKCGRKIMDETKKIRQEVTKVIESITKETFEFSRESQEKSLTEL